MYKFQLLAALVVFLLATGCNDPITIGSEIETNIDVQFTDTLQLKTSTVSSEPNATFSLGVNYNTYLMGELNDPVFGKSTSDVYMNVGLTFAPDFSGAFLDSMVLLVKYDTLGFYGNRLASYDIKLHQLTEKVEGDTINSDQVFAYGDDIIGGRYYSSINPRDSVEVENHLDSSKIVKKVPHLRIPFDYQFAKTFLEADSATYSSVEDFEEFFKGIYMTASTSDNGMIGLDLGDVTNSSGTGSAGINSIELYYHYFDNLAEQVNGVYKYALSPVTFSHFEHDYAGSVVEPYLEDPDYNNRDLAFYQGMAGVETVIDFPHIRNFSDKIINKAELIYYGTIMPEPTPDYIWDPVDIATVTYLNEDGEQVLTADATIGLSPGPYSSFLGGIPTQVGDTPIYKHTINLTNHFSSIINNPERVTSIKLTSLQKSERSSRTIIFGSGDNSQYKPVLKLTYTNT